MENMKDSDYTDEKSFAKLLNECLMVMGYKIVEDKNNIDSGIIA